MRTTIFSKEMPALKNLNFAEFENPKIRLNDGSRIIGKKIKREVM